MYTDLQVKTLPREADSIGDPRRFLSWRCRHGGPSSRKVDRKFGLHSRINEDRDMFETCEVGGAPTQGHNRLKARTERKF